MVRRVALFQGGGGITDDGREVGQARGRTGWCRGAPLLCQPESGSLQPDVGPGGGRVWRQDHRDSIVGRPEGAQPQNTAGGNTTRGETAHGETHPPTITVHS